MVIGTGIDIVELKRIQKAIDRWGDIFLHHVFNKEELEYARKHKYPLQHLAARFAAKEAIVKAIGDNAHISWKDMTILNNKHGQPFCVFHKKKFKKKIFISLSHSENYAVASAIMVRRVPTLSRGLLTTGSKRRTTLSKRAKRTSASKGIVVHKKSAK